MSDTRPVDSRDTLEVWAMRAVYDLGLKEGKRNAELNGTPAFRGSWQVAADYGFTEDTLLRGAFTSGFLEALRNAGQF